MKTKRSKKRILWIVLACVLALLIAGWWAFSVYMYNDNFNKRFESYAPFRLYVEDFEGLSRTRYTFPSDRGQALAGYMYAAGGDPRGIIVIAHGFGGGGHNSYMDVADYFARRGYLVFAYDATGNDESEGAGVGGIPQGVIDLDRAITFIETSGEFPDLPIGLFGHSWGGYSACAVLNHHPEVRAVIECSGCNRSSDLFEAGGKAQAGGIVYTMMPFIRLHEWIKYGKYASKTAMDGFAASEAAVMVVHSADDDVVPIEYGLDLYYPKYKDDTRFTFMRLQNRGHGSVYNDTRYDAEFNAAFDEWLKTLDYDYAAADNRERFIEDKADYINAHLDRTRWAGRLDANMFEAFVGFYDAHMGRLK